MDTPEFFLIPDSNILRTRDEKMAFFSSDFLAAMAPRVGVAKRAFVTQVTAGEIAFQKFGIAAANVDKLNGASKALTALTGKVVAGSNLGDLRPLIEAQLFAEMKKQDFEFLKTPVEAINWNELIDDAVWRRPPFEGTAESKNEKGFRDAIFVHTVLATIKHNGSANWCILTNDGLVFQRLEAGIAEAKFGECKLFRTTDEFLGHVELSVQKLEAALAANLQAKAHVAFYNPQTKTGVAVSGNVENLITAKHGVILASVPPASSLFGAFNLGSIIASQPYEFWSKASDERIFLEGTRFDKRETNAKFQWVSRIRMCALFTRGIAGQQVYPPSIIRDTRFDVSWVADVDDTGFSNAVIRDIKLVSNERLNDSPFTRIQLDLPVPENSVFAAMASQGLSTNVAVQSGSASAGLPPPPLSV